MINVMLTMLNSAAMVAGAPLFGLIKKPPPVIPPATAITRVAETAEMAATKCDLNETQQKNGAKFDATAIDKRVKIKRDKNKDVAGGSERSFKFDTKYYSNVYYEGSVPAAGSPVINIVMDSVGAPMSESYIMLGNETYKLPSTFQTVQQACNVPKGGIMVFCRNPTFIRIALNREIVDRMASSGSSRIRWISRVAPGAIYGCNYLAAGEAKSVQHALSAS